MKDIHIEVNEVLEQFRNYFWGEAQCLLHADHQQLSGEQIGQLAIVRAAERFKLPLVLDARGLAEGDYRE